MPLTDKHLKDVCLLHQGHKQCRYLDNVEGDTGWFSSYICKKKTQKNRVPKRHQRCSGRYHRRLLLNRGWRHLLSEGRFKKKKIKYIFSWDHLFKNGSIYAGGGDI